MPNCKACEHEIVFIRTPKGKFMPCDIEDVTVITKGGEVLKGKIPHFATCPKTAEFKK
jgi:hypothetical protein